MGELRLLEVGLDPDLPVLDDGEDRVALLHVLARLQLHVADRSVDRRLDPRVGQRHRSLVSLGAGAQEPWMRLGLDVGVAPETLQHAPDPLAQHPHLPLGERVVVHGHVVGLLARELAFLQRLLVARAGG